MKYNYIILSILLLSSLIQSCLFKSRLCINEGGKITHDSLSLLKSEEAKNILNDKRNFFFVYSSMKRMISNNVDLTTITEYQSYDDFNYFNNQEGFTARQNEDILYFVGNTNYIQKAQIYKNEADIELFGTQPIGEAVFAKILKGPNTNEFLLLFQAKITKGYINRACWFNFKQIGCGNYLTNLIEDKGLSRSSNFRTELPKSSRLYGQKDNLLKESLSIMYDNPIGDNYIDIIGMNKPASDTVSLSRNKTANPIKRPLKPKAFRLNVSRLSIKPPSESKEKTKRTRSTSYPKSISNGITKSRALPGNKESKNTSKLLDKNEYPKASLSKSALLEVD
jgi:hypothetical protein